MALSPQEIRCVQAVAVHLASRYGGAWEIAPGSTPDELYPSEPSPDALLSSGGRIAAVEVKRLTGDGEWNDYRVYRRSLMRSLAPSAGGHWVLVPAMDFRYPMTPATRRLLKRQIESLGQTMSTGEESVVVIPREALISLTTPVGDGWVFCCHNSSGAALLSRASSRITGKFMLVDCDTWEHSFETDSGRESFVDEIVRACSARVVGGDATARWNEEWKLIRGDDGEGSVEVVAVTAARDVWGANQEAVDLVLDSALAKFSRRRWGDLQIVVLDEEGIMLETEYVVDAVLGYPAPTLVVVDAVLVLDRQGQLVQAWADWP